MENSNQHNPLNGENLKKTDFVSLVVHQLRTPLAGIKWTLKSVINGDMGPLNDEQRQFLSHCYESNDRMIALVNDMLNTDQINAGKFSYNLRDVQLLDLINSLLFDVSNQAKRRKIDLRFIHPDVLPMVSIDIDKTRAVFQNFLENAIKYTPEGGVVTLDVRQSDHTITISVEDNGIGIPEGDRGNIFKSFFRAKNAAGMEKDGSGLGLFIVKNIVEGQGGKVWFESAEGKGTTFYFTIPIKH